MLSQIHSRVLDLGCGDGVLRPYIKDYVGLDISKTALLKRHANSVLGDAQELPFNSCVFSHVLMCEVLEHIPDQEKTLKEVWRVLSPNGHVFLSVPYGNNPHQIRQLEALRKYRMINITYQDGRLDVPYVKALLESCSFQVCWVNVLALKGVSNSVYALGEKTM
jgi:SAM-dependent methyltransferase